MISEFITSVRGFFFFQAEDGIRDKLVTGVQTCALPILGESSRLYQKLVKGDESVVSIQGEVDDRRGPSALYIFALPKPGQDVATIREQISREVDLLATDGPSEEEMEKLRNTLRNDAVRGRQSTLYRAQRIAE